MAAETCPPGEKGEREGQVLGMEEIPPGFLDRRPEGDGRRKRHGEPGRFGSIAWQESTKEEVGGGRGGGQPG